jgi:hypothetical protein
LLGFERLEEYFTKNKKSAAWKTQKNFSMGGLQHTTKQ